MRRDRRCIKILLCITPERRDLTRHAKVVGSGPGAVLLGLKGTSTAPFSQYMHFIPFAPRHHEPLLRAFFAPVIRISTCAMSSIPTIKLNDGTSMPKIGFGTGQSNQIPRPAERIAESYVRNRS